MTFDATMRIDDGTAVVRLTGELDGRSAPTLNQLIADAVAAQVGRLVLLVHDVTYMSSAGIRCLVFAHQKLPRGAEIVLVGTRPEVAETIRLTGFDRSVVLQESVTKGPAEV
ncbi:hypothetical protein GCM10009530_38870 [Microbispora corallina]|uniref:Anti-sigma factor antagonist n=1 Tax=Microbispora corallina TaxID=83302 RepID=A0ABQ4G2R3_9ACTN|nr:anti-sigma factor antagonist [Microbispora corallina]GIH41335.1 hypothetical protein Mco01_43350 [Microbispora corallina]